MIVSHHFQLPPGPEGSTRDAETQVPKQNTPRALICVTRLKNNVFL